MEDDIFQLEAPLEEFEKYMYQYAYVKGFKLRLDRLTRDSQGCKSRQFICYKSGVGLNSKQSQRCDCPFAIYVRREGFNVEGTPLLKMRSANFLHNHELFPYNSADTLKKRATKKSSLSVGLNSLSSSLNVATELEDSQYGEGEMVEHVGSSDSSHEALSPTPFRTINDINSNTSNNYVLSDFRPSSTDQDQMEESAPPLPRKAAKLSQTGRYKLVFSRLNKLAVWASTTPEHFDLYLQKIDEFESSLKAMMASQPKASNAPLPAGVCVLPPKKRYLNNQNNVDSLKHPKVSHDTRDTLSSSQSSIGEDRDDLTVDDNIHTTEL